MAALAETLALMRFGALRLHPFYGRGTGPLLVGLVFAGALIWAITRPARNSMTND